MPRTSRMIIDGEKAVYHVMSHTALDGFPLKYVYEAGAISRPEKRQAKVIDDKVIAKEHKKIFSFSRLIF